MVPQAVGIPAGGLLCHPVVVEHHPSVLNGHQGAFLSSPTGGEESGVVFGGAEPEHQRVVLNGGAREHVLVEGDGLCSVHADRVSRGGSPVGTMHCQCRAVGYVVEYFSTTLVHGVVCGQFALIAREAFEVCLDNFVGRDGLEPQACLQHIALVSMAECQGGGTCVGRSLQHVAAWIGHVLGAGIELYLVGNVVVGHHHTGEGCHGFEGEGLNGVVVDGAIQPVAVAVGHQAKGNAAVLGGMSKEFLRAVGDGGIRLDHHVDGERFG